MFSFIWIVNLLKLNGVSDCSSTPSERIRGLIETRVSYFSIWWQTLLYFVLGSTRIVGYLLWFIQKQQSRGRHVAPLIATLPRLGANPSVCPYTLIRRTCKKYRLYSIWFDDRTYDLLTAFEVSTITETLMKMNSTFCYNVKLIYIKHKF